MPFAHVRPGLIGARVVRPVLIAWPLARLNGAAEHDEPDHENEDESCQHENGDEGGQACAPSVSE